MITRIINILLIIFLGLAGYKPQLLGLSIRFEIKDNIKIYIDPVFLYEVNNILPDNVVGRTNGDIILLQTGYEIFIPHEYNHVKQFQALGDFLYLADFLNLEGYPYYPAIDCNDYMWKPPDNWPFKWGLIEITIPLPDSNR